MYDNNASIDKVRYVMDLANNDVKIALSKHFEDSDDQRISIAKDTIDASIEKYSKMSGTELNKLFIGLKPERNF